MTPRQQTKLRLILARVKGETIGTLECIEEVAKVTLKQLRGSGDVQLPDDLHQKMQLITSGFHKVLSGQQKVRGIREACKLMEKEL